MKMKMLFVLALVLVMTTAGYAQTGLNGKWVTDPPAAPAAAPAAPPAGGAPAGAPGGGGGGGRGGGGRGGGGGGQTRLDLTVAAGKVTGSMFEGGADLEIKEGTATDKQAKWYTIRPLNGADFRVNWTADLTDENAITLNREFPNGVPGGGGRGGGAPGGAPAAGGAPAGGGGGRGGGGGGGGRGGAPAAVTLHRAK